MNNQSLAELGERLSIALPQDIIEVSEQRGELVVICARPSIVRVLTYLRDDPSCQFDMLVDLCAVDWPADGERFEIVYNLLSLRQVHRIRVKLRTDEDTPVPSVSRVYSAANWLEREVWDLFGVFFSDHPDLRRILTDYGFDGHPLRKEFPLTGYVEVRYDEELKRVVYEPVRLTQEFRSFDFLSPWEGMTDVMLPGDEKAHGPITGGDKTS